MITSLVCEAIINEMEVVWITLRGATLYIHRGSYGIHHKAIAHFGAVLRVLPASSSLPISFGNALGVALSASAPSRHERATEPLCSARLFNETAYLPGLSVLLIKAVKDGAQCCSLLHPTATMRRGFPDQPIQEASTHFPAYPVATHNPPSTPRTRTGFNFGKFENKMHI